MNATQLLKIILMVAGITEVLAFGSVFMPRSWMVYYHELLGLGEFPPLGVTDFMIRQASYAYGMHGALLCLMSLDPPRYRPLLILTGIGYVISGPLFLWIDWSTQMPQFWTIIDGPICFAFGVAVLILVRGIQPESQSA